MTQEHSLSVAVTGFSLSPVTGTSPRSIGLSLGGAAGTVEIFVSTIVGSAPKSAVPTDAQKLFSRMGWYDMAAFAVVRAGCCPDAKPLELPEPGKGCDDMAQTLSSIGQEVVANHPAEESLKKYTAAIHCELSLGRGQLFRKAERPTGGEDTAFLELVKAIQSP
jgi:hypothetical protein